MAKNPVEVAGIRGCSAVEIEVARRALLEPEAVMLRRVLEELWCFFEHVLTRFGVLLLERVLNVVLHRLPPCLPTVPTRARCRRRIRLRDIGIRFAQVGGGGRLG